jgi:hypothetical protein
MTTSTDQFYQKPMKMTKTQAVIAILKFIAILPPLAIVCGLLGRGLWECAKLGFNLFGLL